MEDSPFWAGYRDCGEQAIHFLLQSGSLSEDDPVIQGLRAHLREKAHQLALQESLDNTQDTTSKSYPQSVSAISIAPSSPGHHKAISLDISHDNHQMDLEHSLDEGYDSSINNVSVSDTSDLSLDLTTSCSQHDLSLDLSSPILSSSFNVKDTFCASSAPTSTNVQQSARAHTVTVDSLTPIMHHQVTCPVTTCSCSAIASSFTISDSTSHFQSTKVVTTGSGNSGCGHVMMRQPSMDLSNSSWPLDLRGVDPFQDPVGLALLAQNNPEIASVAQELLELLSEDCEDELLEESEDEEDEEDMYEDIECVDDEDVMAAIGGANVVNEDVMGISRGPCGEDENHVSNSDNINKVEGAHFCSLVSGDDDVTGSDASEVLVTLSSGAVCMGEDNKENDCSTVRKDVLASTPTNKTTVFNSVSPTPRQLSPLQVKSNN